MQGVKFVPTEDQLEIIRKGYENPYIRQTELAASLGINHYTLTKIANSMGLTKKRFTVWSLEKVDWLKNNYQLPYREMCEYLGFDEETIRKKLNELGIVRESVHRPYKLDMSDREFMLDLWNPSLTAPDIVEKYKDKYGIGESRIHQLRKQINIRPRVNTIRRESSAEKYVRTVLEDLDVAFQREKRVGRYSVDFYLGFHACIEVQGAYWHSKPKRIKSDERKRLFLKMHRYKILYIEESKLEQAKSKITDFLQNLGFPIQ